jgi:hypothetical protein
VKITTVGIDLAKNVFQFHAVDEHGKPRCARQLRRDQSKRLPPTLLSEQRSIDDVS